MNNTNTKRFGSTAMQLLYVLALNCALLTAVALVSLSGGSVRDILIGAGVNMSAVYGIAGAIFAASAALTAVSGFAARKLGAAA